MKYSELDKILKTAQVPDRPAEYWAQFPKRVVSRLHWRTAARPLRQPRWFPRLAWGLATLAACFLVGFLLGRWQAQKESAAYALLQNQKVISEMLSLFPNQVRAIVQDERGINLVLSDQADVPLSAPLWVKVRDGKRWAAAITFSGQDIQLAGRQFTVLSDGRGGILLMGNDFVWSSEQPAEARSRLKFEARNLGPLTM